MGVSETTPAATPAATPPRWWARHPALVYTAARVLLLLVVFGVLALLGMRGVALIVLAFLLSGAISLLLLNGPREGMAGGIAGRMRRWNARIDESSRAEDVDDDPPRPR